MIQKKSLDLSVYFVIDPSLCAGRAPGDVLREALEGGVTCVQYREKTDSPSNNILHNSKTIQAELKGFFERTGRHVPFLINDHVEIAKEIDADGVHIGQNDMDVVEARRILGKEKIIGLTAFTEAQIREIDPSVVDYIGTGPVYPTQTDKGKPVLGVEEFGRLVALSSVPVVGIGGITPENASPVIHAGAVGVAMMRSISESKDPQEAAEKFIIKLT